MRPLLLLMIASSVLIAGCQSSGPRNANEPPPVRMLDSHWALVALGGAPPEGETQITLHLGADGQAAGQAGINRYSGPYNIGAPDRGAGPIAFGELVSTKMGGDPAMMQQETRYLEMLRAVNSYRAGGGLLELSNAGRPLLRFRQTGAPTAP